MHLVNQRSGNASNRAKISNVEVIEHNSALCLTYRITETIFTCRTLISVRADVRIDKKS